MGPQEGDGRWPFPFSEVTLVCWKVVLYDLYDIGYTVYIIYMYNLICLIYILYYFITIVIIICFFFVAFFFWSMAGFENLVPEMIEMMEWTLYFWPLLQALPSVHRARGRRVDAGGVSDSSHLGKS